MEWAIPEHERTYLRELAKKQAGYAALPVMQERRKMWYALNDGERNARPPVIIETWTFDRDFLPENVYMCSSETGRQIEKQLLRNVRNHEFIDDDKVIDDVFGIDWFVDMDEFGVKIEHETVKDFQGVETGFRYLHPIKDLKRDFALLKDAACSVDRNATMAWKAFLEELFDGVLKVELRTRLAWNAMLTNRVIELMGMEAFFMAMYDTPDDVHRLMAFLRDNALGVMRWAEAEGLLQQPGDSGALTGDVPRILFSLLP